MNPGESPQRASLLSALAEAERAFKRLRMDDPRRAEVARRIRAIEAAIDGLEAAA